MTEKVYEVAVNGGGVCGTALLYMLAEYTDTIRQPRRQDRRKRWRIFYRNSARRN